MNVNDILSVIPAVETQVVDGVVMARFHGSWMGITNKKVLQIMRNYNTYLSENRDSEIL